jgi:CheY-like chemotaxis protein
MHPSNIHRYNRPRGFGMKAIHGAPIAKLVVVIEDDPLVLEATEGLLRSWGCQVIAAESYGEALARLGGQRPDLIVCDYRLSQGETGPDAIEALRSAFEIPALLISADAGIRPADGRVDKCHLLHKPINAATFRALLIDASVLQR